MKFNLFNKNVEKIVKYKCKICGNTFDKKHDATECASKGTKKSLQIGTIFKMYDYENMVFAIIKEHENTRSHYNDYSTWACRDSTVGDNCSGENYCGLYGCDAVYAPNIDIPAYKRMVEALQKAGIEPIDYVEE